jgi:Ser/Thr protein kinase RdoA (MazF antagonist)
VTPPSPDLHQLARHALAAFDVQPGRLRLIARRFNAVFRVDTPSGDRYALRISPPAAQTQPQIEAELAWLLALARDTDLCVPVPQLAANGHPLVIASLPDAPEPRACALFGWLPGTLLSDRLTPRDVERAGALSAHLHHHAGTYHPAPGFVRPVYDRPFPRNESPRLWAADLPPPQLNVFRRAAERVQIAINRRIEVGEPWRVIHSDLHPDNLLVRRESVCALDFEDMVWGFPVQDVGITTYYLRRYATGDVLAAAFRRGYETVRPWPESYSGEVDTFTAGRALVIANWMLSSRPGEDLSGFLAEQARLIEALLPS